MFSEVRVRSGVNWANFVIARRWRELSWDTKYLDAGALNVAIPTTDAAALGLADLSVVEIAPDGNSFNDHWFYIDGTSGTKIADDELWTSYSGKSLVALLDEAKVYPSAWPSATPAGHSFLNATAGTIVQTLVARAQGRGDLAWLDVSTFTGTTTSNAVGWNATVTLTYDNGTGLFQVLQDLAARGMVMWRMNGRQLLLYNLDAVITHRTPEVATFRRGKAVLDQTQNTDSSGWASAALVVGDQNQAVERTSATNLAAIGRRREIYIAQSGITDIPTLQMIGDRYLSLAHLKSEETVGATDTTGPWTNYLSGDWVWLDKDGTLVEMQVAQIAASAQDENNLKIGLTLGDLLDMQDVRVARILQSITNGGGAIPTPVTNDGGTPSAPTGVGLSVNPYRDNNGIDHDQVTVSWTAPTTNTDGSALTDLEHYDVEWTDAGGTWSAATTVQAGTVVAYFSNLTPGQTVTFRVRGVDNNGNASAWASSSATLLPGVTTAPPTPATPTVASSFQGLVVSWSGLTSGAAAYDASWWRTNVHVGTTAGFTPSTANLVGVFATRGGTLTVTGLAYATTYFVKLIAVDKSGNQSLASAASSGTTAAQLSDPDLPAKLVQGAKIADGAVSTAQLTVAAFGDSVLPNGGFEEAATAAGDNAGSAHWKVGPVTGSPVTTRDTTTRATGTSSTKVALPTNATVTGSIANNDPIPVSTGDIWYVRFKAMASRSSVASVVPSLSCAYDTAHLLAIGDANNPLVGFGSLPLTTGWQVFEGQLIVPTGPLNPLVVAELLLQITHPSDSTALNVWIDDVTLAPVRGSAYIADASISNAKINNLSADKITAGSIRSLSLDSSTLSGTLLNSSIDDSCFYRLTDQDTGAILVYHQTPTAITQTIAGSYSYSPAAGITSVKIEAWGAGGAGSAAANLNGYDLGGSGGGSGEYAREDIVPVSNPNSYSYTVGAGGAGGTSGSPSGGDGGDSFFTGDGGFQVRAHGGGGAAHSPGGPPALHTGIGGSGSTNSVKFSGANGGQGQAFIAQAPSGGGAASAGTGAAGNAGNDASLAGTGGAARSAPAGGGAGGAGSTLGAGSAGSAPGGAGGGGASDNSSVHHNGGGGGNGKVVITQYVSVLVASIAGQSGTDPLTGAAYAPGIKIYRPDLIGVPGGYAVNATFNKTGVVTATTTTLTGLSSKTMEVSDFPDPWASGVFTPPAARFYDLSIYADGVASSTRTQVLILVNGNQVAAGTTSFNNSVSASITSYWLVPTDSVTFQVRQTSGGNAAMTGIITVAAR